MPFRAPDKESVHGLPTTRLNSGELAACHHEDANGGDNRSGSRTVLVVGVDSTKEGDSPWALILGEEELNSAEGSGV